MDLRFRLGFGAVGGSGGGGVVVAVVVDRSRELRIAPGRQVVQIHALVPV